MKKYEIKKFKKDFIFIQEINNKGSREKRTAIDKKGKKAICKYKGYKCSEACSEKLSYEIAKILKYDCAHIELARDEKGTLGILNYLFVDIRKEEHIDAVAYIKKNNEERKQILLDIILKGE